MLDETFQLPSADQHVRRSSFSIILFSGANMTQGLTPEQKRFYEDNGYILVKGVFSKEEAAAYRKESPDLPHRVQKIRAIDATWSSVRAPENHTEKKTVILHCHDVQFQSAAFSQLI